VLESIRRVDSVSAAINAMTSPSRLTPSIPEPVSMIVAAWVSWVRFRVKVSPFAVVTSSSSGTSPTVRFVPPGTTQAPVAVRAGFITTPIPTRIREGARKSTARVAMASFFNTTDQPPGYWRGLSSWDSRSRWQVS
jgi:hypothetical protein